MEQERKVQSESESDEELKDNKDEIQESIDIMKRIMIKTAAEKL